MTTPTQLLASENETSQYETPFSKLVSKKLNIYILSVPARCWLDGVRLAASDVTASVVRLVVSPASQNASTERSFRYGSRIPYGATVAVFRARCETCRKRQAETFDGRCIPCFRDALAGAGR